MFSVNETFESLVHACSVQLYKKNPQHLTVTKSENFESPQCSLNHDFKYFDGRYGDAMIMIRVCRRCDFGDAEVIPPRQKRMVLLH